MITLTSKETPLILIVDDDATGRIMARASLETNGLSVAEAEDGMGALSTFENLRPDLILLDVVMPKMDGFETCKALRQSPRGANVPIVMITALNDIESINQAYDAGATDFITKPINWALLNYRVRYILRSSQALAHRKHLEEQLHQSQKMEALGQLAGGLAHNFSNMLGIIILYVGLMLKEISPDDKFYSHVKGIKEAAEQAIFLTRQLLALSRRQIMQPRAVDVNNIVTETDNMLRRLLGEDISLALTLDPTAVVVKIDPGQLEQVLINLAVNARDAMPSGGKLTIETSKVYLDQTYAKRHPYVKPGYYVMLAVSDSGMGMDTETRTHIFEPFFTTKEVGKGTGLGLSSVYGIVKQSGGSIEVYSEPGQGTSFKIYLPWVAKQAEIYRPKPAIDLPLQGSETILVVEDEDMLRNLLVDSLRIYGYKVLEASHEEEALLICERHKGPIHMMLTDVVMPQMSGRELAERLTPLSPDMEVLFMSGYTGDAILHHGILESSTHFIQKPFSQADLARKIREVLETSSIG
jgi:two-component system cell cycle sensor histidine kinase/response regulator CckA